MKRSKRVSSGSARATPWRVGFAQCDITPPPGMAAQLAGWGYERPNTGTIAPLIAQAIALTDKRGNTAVIIAADLGGIDRSTTEYIRQVVGERHGIAPESLMLGVSHTHAGPSMPYTISFFCGSPNIWYLKRFEAAMIELVGAALARRRPASIRFAAAEAKIGACRRLIGPKGEVIGAPDPNGHYDTHTPLFDIQFRTGGARDPKRVVLVGHGCHPTSEGPSHKWSPDYPGVMREHIEQTLGRGTKAMFVQCCGGTSDVCRIDPATGELRRFRGPGEPRRAGRALAKTVLGYLAGDGFAELDARLSCVAARGELTFAKQRSWKEIEAMSKKPEPPLDYWWARQMIALPVRFTKFRYDAQAWRLGDLTLLGLEHEIVSPLGPQVRAMVRTPHVASFAYVNTVCGYIPTAQIVREGGYEGDSSHRALFLPAPFTTRVEAEFESIVEQAVKRLK